MDRQAIVNVPTGTRTSSKLHACRDAARLPLGDRYGNAAEAPEWPLQSAANAGRGIDSADAWQVLATAAEHAEPLA